MGITIHHLGISQSERVIWLCEELGLLYELVRYARDPVTRMAPAAYKALDAIGTAPIIADDGIMLGESGAIVDYLIHTHGGGRLAVASGEAGYADYLFWYHFANASLLPAIMMDLSALRLGMAPAAPAPDAPLSRTDKAYAAIEQRLGRTPWFAGDMFTAADIMMVFPLTTMRMFAPRDLAPYPHLLAYLQRIGARSAYRRAMAEGDPGFAPMLA